MLDMKLPFILFLCILRKKMEERGKCGLGRSFNLCCHLFEYAHAPRATVIRSFKYTPHMLPSFKSHVKPGVLKLRERAQCEAPLAKNTRSN